MIERFLRDASLKNTKQRCSILNIIESSKSPVTAEEIYKILTEKKEDINLSTVYRTLNTLSEKNVILKVLREDGTASYQMNDMLHNHYITCRICHR
jgi:Fur family ferric uptake transcriptional regulator